MVILSKNTIPDGVTLNWTDRKYHLTDDSVSNIRKMYQNTLQIINDKSIFVFKDKNASLIVNQKNVISCSLKNYIEECAKNYYDTNNLNFESIGFEECSESVQYLSNPKYIGRLKSVNKNYRQRIDQINKRKAEISLVYTSSSRTEKQSFQQEQRMLNNEKNNLYEKFEKNKTKIKELKKIQESINKLAYPKYKESWFFIDSFVKDKEKDKEKDRKKDRKKDKEKEKEKIQEILNLLQNLSPSITMEEIPMITIKVKHKEDYLCSEDQFRRIIQSVLVQFGAIVIHISEYKKKNENDKDKDMKGYVNVSIYSDLFLYPIVKSINDELLKIPQITTSNITKHIIDPILIKDSIVLEQIRSLIKDKGWDITVNGIMLRGNKEHIEKLYELLDNESFGFKKIPIPSDINVDRLLVNVLSAKKKKNQNWYVNKQLRVLLIPETVSEKDVSDYLKQFTCTKEGEDIPEILGDIYMCDDEAIKSQTSVVIYKKNGQVVSEPFCVTCLCDYLKGNIGFAFDEIKNEPIFDRLHSLYENVPSLIFFQNVEEDEISGSPWPSIPIGQFMWNLISEETTASLAKTWLTGMMLYVIHHSQYFTSCPQHPNILLKKCLNVHCSFKGCKMCLCTVCKKWHEEKDCTESFTIPPGFRQCPNCHDIIEKIEACNHMACKCGKHFCYYCGAGPWDSSSPCYSHLSEKHQSCYNDPPDYRKFCKGQSVSDAELEEFYRQYPKFKNYIIPFK